VGRRGTGKTTLTKQIIQQDLKESKLLIYDTLGEYELGFPEADNPLTLIDLLECEEKKIRFNSDNALHFDAVCYALYFTGNITFIVDEIDFYCSPVNIPDNLMKLIRYGRHNGISIIVVSRRPADIPRLLTSQANIIISFKHHEPRDIAYLSEFIPKEYIDKLPSLQDGEFIGYDSDRGSIFTAI
jgi:hypothetical protein